jgi:hypothetical protein
MKTAAPFPGPIFIHSFNINEHLYAGFSTSKDRIYEVMFDRCIDICYVGTWENKGAQ